MFGRSFFSSRNSLRSLAPFRSFTTTPALFLPKPLPPLPVIPDSDFTEAFLKGSGPGGQKINKTSSAVQLKHLPTGIVVKCQETRSRSQNRKIARRLLQERLEEIQLGDGARSNLRRERERKKKDSASKKSKRKYRALEGERAAEAGAGDEGGTEGREDERIDADGSQSAGHADTETNTKEVAGRSEQASWQTVDPATGSNHNSADGKH